MIAPLLDDAGIAALREGLRSADYTAAGVAKRLDPRTAAALRAGDAALVRHWLTDDDPQATLIRLFLAGGVEPDVPVPVDGTVLVRDGDGVRAAVEIQPYEDGWIVADLPARGGALSADPRPPAVPSPVGRSEPSALRADPRPPGPPSPVGRSEPSALRDDHVLGIGGASTTLALATVRHPVGSALDLGTGCGVQALHLSRHAARVTATDVSERALRYAATTAALSGLDWELLHGDLVAPVTGRRFDLVVSNPPFIVGPAERRQVTYRDSGRAGDAVCAELIAAAPGLLNDGGYAQFLANWAHPADGDWAERVAGWVAGTGLDAWIVQREVTDPLEYVRLWQADTGGADPAEAASWLEWFAAQRIEAVGFGIVTLRAGGHTDPVVRIEDLPQPIDGAFGGLVPEWFARADWLRAHPNLLAERFRLAESVALHRESRPGPDGWAPAGATLALDTGARWVIDTDELAATLLAGCTGALPLADLVALLAVAHGLAEDALAAAVVPVVADLVERGILLPA